MEHTKIEQAILEQVIVDAADAQLRELNELQLTIVGGGTAEVTLI